LQRIHGGAFALGEISYYQGRRLLEHSEIVFVAVQYRLGPFGKKILRFFNVQRFQGSTKFALRSKELKNLLL